MDRKFNFLVSFLLVGIFIFSADATQHLNFLLGLLLSGFVSLVAYLLRQISMDGMFAAGVVGTATFGLGGFDAAFIILLFFISGSVLSYGRASQSEDLPIEVRRNGLQIWANGIWFVIFLIFSDIFAERIFLVGALSAIAVATADTWATEMGSRKRSSTYLITDFRNVEPGTDGGISLIGTTAAFLGSSLIALISIYVFSLELYDFIYIFIAGFFGCLIDSYLGAFYQRTNTSVKFPILSYRIHMNNNVVNAVSTGAGALLAITLKIIFI